MNTEPPARPFETLQGAVSKEPAKTHICRSRLGLGKLTRQRMRPSLETRSNDTCSYCDGKGMIQIDGHYVHPGDTRPAAALRGSRDRIVNVYVHPDVSERLFSREEGFELLERRTASRNPLYSEPTAHRRIQYHFYLSEA